MGWLSAFAIYFIIWWVTLFTVLPIGVRSQAEDSDVILGTETGAPQNPRLGFKVLLTTAISFLVFGVFYWLTVINGWGVNDIPTIVPDFPDR
ncbi:MAG: DUF1467 family protein [Pseudomonadota bacterium]